MHRLAVLVAQTAVGATVPTALVQATASPLHDIEADARLDPDVAAPPLVAMNVSLGLKGMARGAWMQRAKIQRAKIQRAKIQRVMSAPASTVHPVITAANDSGVCGENGSVPMPPRARVWNR